MSLHLLSTGLFMPEVQLISLEHSRICFSLALAANISFIPALNLPLTLAFRIRFPLTNTPMCHETLSHERVN